jgi:ABC-type transport system involved in cytochrome bd biosynthesis fused ATPase/permease subunit
MSMPIRLRRPAVLLGVVLALLVGAATIRGAAAWTAANSPLIAKPPSVDGLLSALDAEQARSNALQAQLDELIAGSTELTTALAAARDRIAQDASQAEALQSSLADAKAKLEALERSIRQAGAAAAPAVALAPVAAAAPSGADSGEGEHEEHDDD